MFETSVVFQKTSANTKFRHKGTIFYAELEMFIVSSSWFQFSISTIEICKINGGPCMFRL